jgi:DNA-binding XRE family transcriptional regulator
MVTLRALEISDGTTISELIQTAKVVVNRLGRVPAAKDPFVQERRLALARVVRTRREVLGISQEKLAERAGYDRQSVNRIENAQYSPVLDRVFLLAEALGVSLGTLFAEVDAEVVRRGSNATPE